MTQMSDDVEETGASRALVPAGDSEPGALAKTSPPPRAAPARRGGFGRLLRLLLPLAALALVTAVFVLSARSGIDNAANTLVDGLVISGGLEVTNPRYLGEMSDGSPFRVSAKRAQPDGPDPKRIALSGVEGDLTLPEGRALNATAADGLFKPKDKSLRLGGGVVARTNDGYSLAADAIQFDLEKRTGETESPVRIEGPLGEVTADKMEARVETDLVARFTGDVKVVIRKLVEPNEGRGVGEQTPEAEIKPLANGDAAQ